MAYQFDFSWIWEYWSSLATGAGVTLLLITLGGLLGVALGTVCAWVRALGPKRAQPFVSAYVEAIRNTPFLIQLYFIFFGLPSIGLSLSGEVAALLTVTINLGAYSCEIIRAGIQATPKGQFEAGASLAMSPFQTFWYVVLRPAMKRIWPALSSQLIIVMFSTAVVSQISVEDITFAANFIQSRNFRAFETYIVATIMYLVLALVIRQVLNGIGFLLFGGRR